MPPSSTHGNAPLPLALELQQLEGNIGAQEGSFWCCHKTSLFSQDQMSKAGSLSCRHFRWLFGRSLLQPSDPFHGCPLSTSCAHPSDSGLRVADAPHPPDSQHWGLPGLWWELLKAESQADIPALGVTACPQVPCTLDTPLNTSSTS